MLHIVIIIHTQQHTFPFPDLTDYFGVLIPPRRDPVMEISLLPLLTSSTNNEMNSRES